MQKVSLWLKADDQVLRSGVDITNSKEYVCASATLRRSHTTKVAGIWGRSVVVILKFVLSVFFCIFVLN